MEGDDPYNWTVNQVCEFFREDVQNVLYSIPNNPQLPAWSPFLEALKFNDVSGFVLLTSVGTSDLRDEFGIRSFGQRSTLLYCINKLRERSSAYHSQHGQQGSPQVSTATHTLGQSHTREALPTEPTIPTSTRAGEVQVQDDHGRKRRKLHLISAASAASDPLPPTSGHCYFSKGSMPVDGLFFSKTLLGREIEHSESAELTTVDTDLANDSTEYNFQFHALSKPAGEAQYVYRQNHRFLRQDPIDLVRRGHYALAIMPYREELSQIANKVQSAIVVQCAGDSNSPVAMRENTAHLENGGDYNGIAQESALGQYDYLSKKYRGGELGDSDSDSDSVSSAAFDRMNVEIEAEWESERAEVAASQAKRLTTKSIGNVIDETIEGFVEQWIASRQPVKEQNQAWSVWKSMKGSKSRRLGLIEDAKAKIDSFDRRLSGQKSYVVKAECCTRDEVVKLCEALKATVIDREEQRWKIGVWQRKLEPEHVVRYGKHTGRTIATSASQSVPAFPPQPEDRLSVEPGPTPAVEHQGDVLLTPQSCPTPLQGAAHDEGVDGSDEASKINDFVEDDVGFLGDPPHDGNINSSHDREDDDEASVVTPLPVHIEQGQRFSSSSEPPSEDQLHGMDQFFTSDKTLLKNTVKETPEKTSKHVFSKPSDPASASRPKAPVVIDLSSDSSGTPNTRSTKIRRGHGRTSIDRPQNAVSNSMPENSSVQDVDSWNIEYLVREQDRKRIVIKLLREEGAVMIFAIKALWIQNSMVGFKDAVLQLLKVLREGPGRSDAQPAPLLQSARLAIVWSCLRPEVMKGNYPEEIDWNAVDRDTTFFISFFGILMQKSDSKLFNEPSPSPYPLPRKQSKSEPIEIDSNSDEPVVTPHSKRRRRVKYSQKAVETQNTAMERQKRYKAAETQSSNSQQLLAMVGSGCVMLPIDLLKQAEGAHFIYPAVASVMKDHQINGVRFMWREITAGADTDDDGQGCVLAHAMGLGKTMQTITLLVAVTDAAHSKDPRVSSQLPRNLRPEDVALKERSLRVLVLCPPALLENWRREIQLWANGILGDVFTVDASNKAYQMDILRDWHVYGGVLLMGYSLFSKRIRRAKAEEKAGKAHEDGALLDEYLLRGPEILVADEAHHVKNIGAGVSIAVNKVETRIRIALTGTPMSNDVGEMYALISFAAPGFLGGHVEFKAKFGEPIEQGTYADSSSYEQRRSKVKLATLSRLIEPKIHRADITALKGTLQPKLEFVVTLPLTDLQRTVYNKYLDALLGGGKNDKASQVTIFSWLSLLGLLTNHPLAFKRKLNETKKSQKSKSGKSSKVKGGSASPVVADDDDSAEGVDYEEEGLKTLGFSEETVELITADIQDSTDPSLSAKMHILMEILALSKRCGDKVLVFSSSIPTLNYVGDLLRARGTQFGRICGSVPAPKRPRIITDLTDGFTDILLISTKAGGVGLNIQAANRVVILDFGFNPAHEEQAIGRAYRFGQPKPVFVYRLIAGGTFEDNIYNKQLFKTSLTQRVVDKKNPRRNAARSTRHYLYEPKEVYQQDLAEWVGKDPDVFDQLLQPQLSPFQGMIRKLTTIETLQREGDDPPLDAEELRQAEEEYQTSIAAAMGPRGQAANMENVPAFVAAQARQILQPSMKSTQQASRSKLMVTLPVLQPSSTAPVRDSRPGQTIRMASTLLPHNLPHGLPDPTSPRMEQ